MILCVSDTLSRREVKVNLMAEPELKPTGAEPAYRFIDLHQIEIPCGCGATDTSYKEDAARGFSSKLSLFCKVCGSKLASFGTSSVKEGTYDVNKRAVLAFREMGSGFSAMKSLGKYFNMPILGHSGFQKCQNGVKCSILDEIPLWRAKTAHAVRSAHQDIGSAGSKLSIAVSYDGTWMKRGHTSHIGVGLVVDVLTGLVIDFEVISNFCLGCSKVMLSGDELEAWKSTHKCEKNFDGTAAMMEVAAAERIWLRSESLGFRYTTIISDGDSKTFNHLQELSVYGPEVPLVKEECLNHVAKRLGTGLRKFVAESNLTNYLCQKEYYKKQVSKNADTRSIA